AGQPGDAARCRELGINGYLMKPIKQSELLGTILVVLGTTPSVGGAGTTTAYAPRTPQSWHPGQRSLRVLLCEDELVNQKVAVCLLEKQGHTVAVAGKGHEAVAAMERQSFDVVLMDVQMPEMDGLEATLIIRQREREAGRHTPILAMTAFAMKGDRERCLA